MSWNNGMGEEQEAGNLKKILGKSFLHRHVFFIGRKVLGHLDEVLCSDVWRDMLSKTSDACEHEDLFSNAPLKNEVLI